MNPKYKQLYLSEADEKLQALNEALLILETQRQDSDAANNAMRAAHTLKSSSAVMKLDQISTLAHQMEDSFEQARSGEALLTNEDVEHLFRNTDALKEAVNAFRNDEPELDLSSYLHESKSISATELGTERVHDLRVPIEMADQLMNVTEELLVEQMHLAELLRNYDEQPDIPLNPEKLQAVAEHMSRLTSDLQYYVTDIRLIPLGQIFQRFPRMIRDLAKEKSKQVEFSMTGQDIELDRSIIDRVGEPILHLLRNAIDHGLQSVGTIKLHAQRLADVVVIDVEDNGGGINWKDVHDAAVNRGIIQREELMSMSNEEKEKLIFHPKLSTSKTVTETSGRGVGLSVVQTVMNDLGGSVSVAVPESGKGTRFRLRVPITLAIIKALLVKIRQQVFAVPFVQVDRSVRVASQQIRKALDQEIAVVQGVDIPMVRLENTFWAHEPRSEPVTPKDQELMVIVNYSEFEKIGLIVDELITEQEIVVKPLMGAIRKIGGFAGVTLLGDGKPALILDVADLI
jgi:two-component system, chemotaxis family, sensor kinase CheA